MRVSRQVLAFVMFSVALLGAPVFYYFLIVDHENPPLCHKQLLLGIENYLAFQKTNILPNVGGRSADSLREFRENLGDERWETEYKYVPGLRERDPGDLVVAYMPVSTRYIWHGNPQTILRT